MKIAYLCDGELCEKCDPDKCNYTTDITHAKNFKRLDDDTYYEDITRYNISIPPVIVPNDWLKNKPYVTTRNTDSTYKTTTTRSKKKKPTHRKG